MVCTMGQDQERKRNPGTRPTDHLTVFVSDPEYWSFALLLQHFQKIPTKWDLEKSFKRYVLWGENTHYGQGHGKHS